MRDIEKRADIETIVEAFYSRALDDDLIQHFFLEVARIEWDVHIPIICNFWDSILLGSNNYKANAMIKHIDLHQKSPLSKEHFERWIQLWEKTVRTFYQGPIADTAILKAKQIGGLMQHKISGLELL